MSPLYTISTWDISIQHSSGIMQVQCIWCIKKRVKVDKKLFCVENKCSLFEDFQYVHAFTHALGPDAI